MFNLIVCEEKIEYFLNKILVLLGYEGGDIIC